MEPETNKPRVSFFTNCYEADWEILLCTSRLETIIESFNYPFFRKGLAINNVTNESLVGKFAQRAVDNGIIDYYFFTNQYAGEILNEMGIARGSFKLDLFDGYWYSMGPLSAIYHCETDWLLYCTCDCMASEGVNGKWIMEAIVAMQKDETVLSATLLWDYKDAGLQLPAYAKDSAWYVSKGFSDQVFLVEAGRFKKSIYNQYHPSSDHFPVYAGNLFERRVNSFQRAFNYQRIVYSRGSYRHEKLVSAGYKVSNNRSLTLKKMAAIFLRKLSRRWRLLKWKYFKYSF